MRKVQKHAFLLAGVFLLWCAAYAGLKPAQGTGRIIEDFREIPLEIGQWAGVEGQFDDITRKSLKHCALMTRDYENEQGYDSNLSIVYGVDLGDFHQPEVCMEGQGWRRTSSRVVTVPSAKPHQAVMAHMTNDYQQIVVMYWFASQDGATTALGKHKMSAFVSRLKQGKLKPSAMIRLITLVDGDQKTYERITLDLATSMDMYINETLSGTPVFENTGERLLEE